MVKLKNISLIVLFILVSLNTGALTQISGRVVTMDGLQPIAGVRVGLIRPVDFPEGDFEYSTVTDKNGNYRIEGVKEETYIVSAVAWGYNPDYTYSISLHRDCENVEMRLVKYTLPAQIDSVELTISQKGRVIKSLPMSFEGMLWQVPVNVKKRGLYNYSFSVNGESYRYYDLINKNYTVNRGHIESTIRLESNKKELFTFSPEFYRRVDYRRAAYDPFNWFICKSYREDLLRRGVDGGDFLIEKVQEKKIVFLSECHAVINPIGFLASNLADLYHEGGLRYLFLEGYRTSYRDMLKGDFGNAGASLPWENNALRYQWIELMRAIDELNRPLAPDKRLKVINAEEGYRDIDPVTITDEVNNIQKRDIYAYKKISSIMAAAGESDKALIFYGGAHGHKKEYRYGSSEQYIKSLSSYLSDQYEDNFYSINIDNISFLSGREGRFDYPKTSVTEYLYWKKQPISQMLAVEVKESYRNRGSLLYNRQNYDGEELSNYFDGLIFSRRKSFGLPYGYIKNRYTIENLIYLLKNRDEQYAKYSYNQTLYLLKLHLGRRFSYSLWNSSNTLDEAIAELEIVNLDKIRQDSPKIIRQKAEFCDYLVKGKRAFETKFGYIDAIYYLKKAHKLYKDDLYPLYYLMLTNYEMGRLEEARRLGEKLTAAPASYNMVELPEIYSLLAHIYEVLGSSEKAALLRKRMDGLIRETPGQ